MLLVCTNIRTFYQLKCKKTSDLVGGSLLVKLIQKFGRWLLFFSPHTNSHTISEYHLLKPSWKTRTSPWDIYRNNSIIFLLFARHIAHQQFKDRERRPNTAERRFSRLCKSEDVSRQCWQRRRPFKTIPEKAAGEA